MTDNYDDSTERTAPAPAPATTLVQPAVVDEAPARRPRSSVSIALRLIALIVGVAIAGGLTVYLILGGEDKPPAQPAAVLPRPDNVLPTEAGSAPAGTRPSARTSSSAGASASASASAPVSATPSKPQHATSPAGTKPTLEGPPAADRSGKVTAASGRCLMRGGLLGVDGSPIQVADCGVASTFTLATDGTLRVNGRCAQVSGDGTVRIDGCGDQDSAQWRQGPGSSLVNPSTGRCLTDPGRGGATTRAAACTGGSEQRWSLPRACSSSRFSLPPAADRLNCANAPGREV
jgi:hypothetical protein